FISVGKAFLSALAVADTEDLKVICSRLLPHKVTFARAPDAFVSSQSEPFPQPICAADRQPHDAITTDRSPPTNPNPQLNTEQLFDRDLFTAYTTLRDTIIEIIKLGDAFIRDDVESFIESFRLAWSQNGVWDRPPLMDPTRGGTIIEKLFNGFCCAEILEQSSAVDPVRLRVARVVLHHYYKQLCVDARSDPNLLSRRSRGRDTASVATDKILEDMYGSRKDQVDSRTWKRRRDSLQKHKKIGKRWCMLADHLGLGILLACHPSLGTHV
ncbi:hypothetical protein GQ44DRAFT_634738, partial [Phaeosphaeriaceae sp. PMI808]